MFKFYLSRSQQYKNEHDWIVSNIGENYQYKFYSLSADDIKEIQITEYFFIILYSWCYFTLLLWCINLPYCTFLVLLRSIYVTLLHMLWYFFLYFLKYVYIFLFCWDVFNGYPFCVLVPCIDVHFSWFCIVKNVPLFLYCCNVFMYLVLVPCFCIGIWFI